MSTAIQGVRISQSLFSPKHILWLVFALMSLFVLIHRELSLLDPHSFMRQRFAPIPWLMLAHGIPGALALVLGAFQFSSRLRRKYLGLHRVMGRVYVGSVFIAAPVAILVSIALPIPTLTLASSIQAAGWVLCTATALYCARTGRIQQHKEWMMRGYPFAMVFVVGRAIGYIPAVDRMGLLGVEETVWGCIAVACMLPSFIIAWQSLGAVRRPVKPLAAD